MRLSVTVPPSVTRLPDRVRLVVKERGALLFPYRRKVASVRLPLASWTRLPGAAWQSTTEQDVALDVAKLMRKAQWERLALQVYCLHRTKVCHKAIIGSLQRLLQVGRYQELLLDLHYPGLPLEVHRSTQSPQQEAGSHGGRHAHSRKEE